MKRNLMFALLVISLSGYAQDKKIALVIGNSQYENGIGLKKPAGDAILVSFSLEDLGFEVKAVSDADLKEIQNALSDFSSLSKAADVSLLYYAGLGVEANDNFYLVPVDAGLKKKKDLGTEAVDLRSIASGLQSSAGGTRILVLDLAKSTGFPAWEQAEGDVFTDAGIPGGMLIAVSVSPPDVPWEDQGSNGIYASNLTTQLNVPQSLDNLFKNTRLLVSHASNGKQNPREWSTLTKQITLAGSSIPPPSDRGSIQLISTLTGVLSLNGIEIASAEPNSVIPIDNLEEGTYDLRITGDEQWMETVLVLGNQTTNVTAQPEKVPPAETSGTPDIEETGPETGMFFTDKRDGTQYSWKEFGNQKWMTMNLAYNADGSYCYDNNSDNCKTYGRLYTWETARNACPEGWHLPSDEEWGMLEQQIGMKNKVTRRIGLRGKAEGDLLKDRSKGLWEKEIDTGVTASGFNALPGGFYVNEKNSEERGESAIFWTSTKYKSLSAFYRKIEAGRSGIHRYYLDLDKGFSVRCVKD